MPSPLPIQSVNHIARVTHNLEASLAFYRDVLGFRAIRRPNFSFPGAWLYVNGRAVLHIIGGRNVPDPPAGVIDHMAFSASDLGAAIDRIQARGLPFEIRKQVGSGIWQIFVDDPDGAKVELDFDPSESLPERHAGLVS